MQEKILGNQWLCADQEGRLELYQKHPTSRAFFLSLTSKHTIQGQKSELYLLFIGLHTIESCKSCPQADKPCILAPIQQTAFSLMPYDSWTCLLTELEGSKLRMDLILSLPRKNDIVRIFRGLQSWVRRDIVWHADDGKGTWLSDKVSETEVPCAKGRFPHIFTDKCRLILGKESGSCVRCSRPYETWDNVRYPCRKHSCHEHCWDSSGCPQCRLN